MDLHFYVQKLADRMGWDVGKTYEYLHNLYAISPVAEFSILLKEIAIELDKKYDSHIMYSDDIYVISIFNGKIAKADKNCILSYKNFAAFRSLEDAEIASSILEELLNDLFINERQ